MMTLQNLLQSLSPINTKEKVDTLIQEIEKCGLKMTRNAEVVIRCAIQKVSIQKYILSTYSRLFVDKGEPQKMVQAKATLPPKTAKKKSIKAVSKTDINRLKQQHSNNGIYGENFKEKPHKDDATPSILRVFGSNRPKKMSYKEREKIAPHKKEYSTSTKASLYSIGIPMK